MTDIVIPLSAITSNNFLDLRFALRGIAMFMTEPKITLIGALPKWCKGVTHIPATDSPDTMYRERNIFRKLMLAPMDEFIYANDDHFLIAPWVDGYYHNGRLDKKLLVLTRGSIYRKTIVNTMNYFPKSSNFDIHCPVMIDRQKLHRISKYDWNRPYGLCMKSLYLESQGIKGTFCEDLKIRNPIINLHEAIAGRTWFSTSDVAMEDRSMVDQFKELFPHKSPWE